MFSISSDSHVLHKHSPLAHTNANASSCDDFIALTLFCFKRFFNLNNAPMLVLFQAKWHKRSTLPPTLDLSMKRSREIRRLDDNRNDLAASTHCIRSVRFIVCLNLK